MPCDDCSREENCPPCINECLICIRDLGHCCDHEPEDCEDHLMYQSSFSPTVEFVKDVYRWHDMTDEEREVEVARRQAIEAEEEARREEYACTECGCTCGWNED